MKKTVKININNSVFYIDEDAYEILEKYLDALKNHFKDTSEGKEILSDIENRIAELFQTMLTAQKQVITIDDIQQIIAIMGTPDDFDNLNQEPSAKESSEKYFGEPEKKSHRFYRDIDNNVIAGVCAGLGAHLNIDAIILRIIFIVLTIPMAGFPFLLYFLLWIILPAATTTEQRMEMKGGNFTIQDIEKSVKDEFGRVKSQFKQYQKTDNYKRNKQSVEHVGNGITRLFRLFGHIFLTIVGVLLIVIGISFILSMLGVLIFSDGFQFWSSTHFSHTMIPDFISSFVHPNSLLLAGIFLTIIIVAPILAIIYWGLKLILRFKANDSVISAIAIIAWIFSIVGFIGISLFEAKDYAIGSEIEDSVDITTPANKTLYIKSNLNLDDYSEVYFFDEGLNIYTHENYSNRIYIRTDLNIKYTSKDEISINIEKEARGINTYQARLHASNVNFNWHLSDSVLYIDPLYYFDYSQPWTFPDIDITLYVPAGQKICIDKNLEGVIDYAETTKHNRYWEISGNCWVMTPDGLSEE